MRIIKAVLFFGFLGIIGCSQPPVDLSIFSELEGLPSLTGKENYLNSPYVAAGDRVYLIGHQNGTFPDLGWHVEGEMGGIWLHPIKLMDGFTASVTVEEKNFCLDKADSFTNYPFSNVLKFNQKDAGIEVERLHFVPDGKEGMVILFKIKNVDNSTKSLRFDLNTYVDLMPVWLGERTGMIDNADEITFNEQTNTFTGKDQRNDWFVVWGSAEGLALEPTESTTCTMTPKGKGANAG
ncbi:MAG TPA: hypothetical protein VLA71_05770, partial [Algoriphagus sp.]|nr:hypothetical protein [Algoriphagus sp.]